MLLGTTMVIALRSAQVLLEQREPTCPTIDSSCTLSLTFFEVWKTRFIYCLFCSSAMFYLDRVGVYNA